MIRALGEARAGTTLAPVDQARNSSIATAGSPKSGHINVLLTPFHGVAARWGDDQPVGAQGAAVPVEEAEVASVAGAMTAPAVEKSGPQVEALIVAALPIEDPVPVMPMTLEAPALDVAEAKIDVAPIMEEEPSASACSLEMTAIEMKMAMVQLHLMAPCHADQIVSIHHSNMVFDAKLDAAGELFVDVPALSENAHFYADFGQAEGILANTVVPDFGDFDRAVVQWAGDQGVELHALEFGASYGEDGHRWAGSEGNFAGAVLGLNGLMVSLGTDLEHRAEIYTFPSGKSSEDGSIVLSVEGEVRAETCGQTVNAKTIQLRPAQDPLVSRISMTLPDCDEVGGYVLLKNVLEDLTIAMR